MPIVVEKLSHTYMAGSQNAFCALQDIELTIEEGEFFGLIGHTGSGKSTLVQLMAGLLHPTSGRVLVNGLDMAEKKQGHQARRQIGLVFQYPEYQLFEETVAKDIAYGPRNLKLADAEVEQRVQEAMELVGLPQSYAGRSPFELSGGEKRRAALAGVIALRPRYLILDEPMAGLDPAGRRDILDTIEALRRSSGCAVIMVSHSMDDIARYAGRVALLAQGRLAALGTPDGVFSRPELLTGVDMDIPQVARLAMELRARGVDIPPLYRQRDMIGFVLGRVKHD